MQQTEYSAFPLLRHIVRHAAWVLVASILIASCGSGSEDSGNNAETVTPESIETRDTSDADTPSSSPASPTAGQMHAEHEYAAPAQNTPTATSTAAATASASPTETPVHSLHEQPKATATTEPDSAGVAEVQILDFSFDPPLLEVKAGTTVTFINRGVDHTATSLDDPSVFDTGILHTGESFSVTFETAGSFDYWCLLHPNMVGEIVVK